MFDQETTRFNDHMTVYGIIMPYNAITYLNKSINRIGVSIEVNGISNEIYTPWEI